MSHVRFHIFNILTSRRRLKVKMSLLGKKLGVLLSSSFFLGSGGISGFLPCLCPGSFPASAQRAPTRCMVFFPFPPPCFSDGSSPFWENCLGIAQIHTYFYFSSFACQNPGGSVRPDGSLSSRGHDVLWKEGTKGDPCAGAAWIWPNTPPLLGAR